MIYKNTILMSFCEAEKLINLLDLSYYTCKYDAFLLNILNRKIILYNDKLSPDAIINKLKTP